MIFPALFLIHDHFSNFLYQRNLFAPFLSSKGFYPPQHQIFTNSHWNFCRGDANRFLRWLFDARKTFCSSHFWRNHTNFSRPLTVARTLFDHRYESRIFLSGPTARLFAGRRHFYDTSFLHMPFFAASRFFSPAGNFSGEFLSKFLRHFSCTNFYHRRFWQSAFWAEMSTDFYGVFAEQPTDSFWFQHFSVDFCSSPAFFISNRFFRPVDF